MARFLLDIDVSRGAITPVRAGSERTRVGAEQLSCVGTPVPYLRSSLMPQHESCCWLEAAAATS